MTVAELGVIRDDADVGRVDSRKLDEHHHCLRVLGAEAIHLRAETASRSPREREDLPQVGEELLDLLRGALEIASFVHEPYGTQALYS